MNPYPSQLLTSRPRRAVRSGSVPTRCRQPSVH